MTKYDIMHLPGVTPPGCGETFISPHIADDHERGDRISIACRRCGKYGPHEIRARLKPVSELR